MKQTDVAWAAGFLDGEGCFSLSRMSDPRDDLHPSTRQPTLSVSQKRREPLEKLSDVLGGNVRPLRRYGEDYGWQWAICGQRLVLVIAHVLPHLTLKTREAEIVMAYAETVKRRGRVAIPADVIQLRERLIDEMDAERGGGR